MKTSNLLLLLVMIVVLSTACARKAVVVTPTPSENPSGHVPPGQAKKMTGSKSAKPYAPGQQKKG